MKKYLSLISLLVLSLVSCNNELENFFTVGEVTTINVSADEFQTGTRTSISNTDYAVSWNNGDMIGIFPMKENAKQIAFEISGGTGSSYATFDGNGWGLKNGTNYAAYYPCSSNAFLDKTNIILDYSGQAQNGNGNSSHLGTYDFLKAGSTQAVNGSLDFQFEHIGTLVHLTFDVPNGTYKKVELHTDGVFYSKAVLNLETGNTLPDEDSETKTLTLNLKNVSVNDGKLEIFTMIYPVDLEGSSIYAYAYNEEGNNVSTTTWKGVTFQPSTVWNGGELIPIPYLTFKADETQTLQMTKAVETLEYSENGGEWHTLGTNTVVFGGSNGNLRLRGKSTTGTAKSYSDYSSITFDRDVSVSCSGDIRTLIDYENYITTSTENARFCSLFYNCKNLTTAPELPATTLTDFCYRYMFYGCTSLTNAPELPAITLAEYCYNSMFYGCSSLTAAPELPATTLAGYCYEKMFHGCTSLTNVPDLPATKLVIGCYKGMYEGCTSLTIAPELPATTLTESCYNAMFSGCTSLTKAPELPATTLADYCYSSMFNGCSGLTTAPELPATALAPGCYHRMFYNTGIKEMPVHLQNSNLVKKWIERNVGLEGLFAGLPVTDEYLYTILPVNSSGKYYLPATTITTNCYSGMFIGCTSLKTAPELPATTLAYHCYSNMFSDCTSLIKAPELPATTLANSCYSSMFSGCTSLTTAPELPATTLATSCYEYMFYGCTNLNYIKMMATDNISNSSWYSWTSGVSSTGTFVKNAAATWDNETYFSGHRFIPLGWTVQTATE